MKKNLLFYEIIGLLFTWIAGALLHFAYQWSGQNPFVAYFAPINESTWEHLKLLFFPMLLYSIIEYFLIGQENPNFFTAKTVGIIAGLIIIPVLFYTYTGIIDKHYLWVDILIFILGVLFSYIVSWNILNREPVSLSTSVTIVIILFLLLLAFMTFTSNPFKIPLFKDPVSQTYGVNKLV